MSEILSVPKPASVRPAQRSQVPDLTAVRAAQQGKRLLQSGMAQEAIGLLQPLVESDRVTPELRTLLAKAYEKAGDRHRARLMWLEIARSGQATDGLHHLRLGRNALLRRDFAEAERQLKAYLATAPQDLAAAEHLLEAQLCLAGPGELREVYARYLSQRPETCYSLTLLATELVRRRPKAEAMEVLDRAREAWDGLLRTALRIAQGYKALGEAETALALLDSAAVRYPNDISLLRNRFRVQQALGAPKATLLETAGRLVVLEPEQPGHHARLARLYANFKDWSAASASWQKALDLDRNCVTYWRGLLISYARMERNAAIEALLKEARQFFRTRGPEGMVDMAVLENVGGYNDRAASLAAGALTNPRTRVRAREAASAALLDAGQYVRAWSYLSAGLDDGTANIETQRMAARCSAALRLPAPTEGVPRFPDTLFERALLHAPERTLIEPGNGVMLVSSSLGAGGAERQVALSAAGIARMRAAAGRGPTFFVGQDLSPDRGRAVMLPVAQTPELQIEDLGPIDAQTVFRSISAADPGAREALRLIAALPPKLSRDVLKLYDCFRRHRPALVHLWQDGVISTGSVAAVLAGVPRIVASMRNVVAPESDRRRYRSYLATMYRSLGKRDNVRFTANSAAGATDYEKWLGFEPGRIAVLRNGVEVANVRKRGSEEARRAARQELGLADDELLMGGTFRLAPAKRPHLWLSVAEQVAAMVPKSRFVIVGDGVLRADLERWIAERGLSGRITLAGRKSPVEPWIGAMDVMLLASEVEGLPNVLLEAQCLGVPVVTTDAGGSREAVLDGITGILVENDVIENLAAAVARVLRDQTMRARTRTGAPAFIEQRFGVQRMLSDTLSLYDKGFPKQGDLE
jgi:glycosyltransferase involved in cell wall biosynthesis/tetratricopeptide (TPR) repeat protein